MKRLKIETKEFDRAYRIILTVFAITAIIAVIYFFLLLLSPVDVMTLKTFLTILITFLITAVIPYSSVRILENAKNRDKNNALKKVTEKVEQKYTVKFVGKPSVNTVALMADKNDERFYGVITLNDKQEPILKTLSDYEKE